MNEARGGLWESDERFQELIEDLEVGVLVQGARAQVLYANPAALSMLAMAEADVLGRTSFDASSLACHEDGSPFPGADHPGPQALATGRPVRNVVMGFYRPAIKDRVWLLVSAHPQVDSDGKARQVVVTLTDITAGRTAVGRLEESEARYRQIVEQAQDIIYRTDVNGRFTYVNPVASRFMGYPERELVGKHFRDLVRSDHRDRVEALLVDQFQRRLPTTYDEFVALTKDGRPVWIGQNVQLLTEGDRVLGFQAVARDITERKRGEAALQKAAQQMTERLGSLGARLRAPLGAALGSLGLLLDSGLEETQREWARSAEAAAREIHALLDDSPDLPPPPDESAPAPGPPPPRAESSEAHSVLVVEDHPMSRRVVAALLETLGYHVDTAADGLEAVEACARRHYDAVLMDCQMPEVDGFRATAWIREREGPARRTPIIALTASVLPGDRERCFAAGMDDFLAKPIGRLGLDAALRKWIRRDGEAPSTAGGASSLPDDHPLRVLEAQGRHSVVVEIIDLFLQTTPLRIEGLRGALAESDGPAILNLAHSLKGAAFQIGARGMAEICHRVQADVRADALDGVGQLLHALKTELAVLREVLLAERRRLAPAKV